MPVYISVYHFVFSYTIIYYISDFLLCDILVPSLLQIEYIITLYRIKMDASRCIAQKSLRVVYWNVQGVNTRAGCKTVSKYSIPGFKENFCGHDIICLSEIKVGPDQNLALEGYSEKLICRKRHKRAKSSSGGLVIHITTEIKQGVTIIPNKSNEYGWMKLAKNFFKTNKDIYLCFAYANPEGSQYRTETGILDQIKQDLAMYKNLGRCILTFGRPKWVHQHFT